MLNNNPVFTYSEPWLGNVYMKININGKTNLPEEINDPEMVDMIYGCFKFSPLQKYIFLPQYRIL